jgi:uncharacterized membrane protein YfcA
LGEVAHWKSFSGGKMSIVTIIWFLLIAIAVVFAVLLVRDALKHKKEIVEDEKGTSYVKTGIVGFITNFLDVLGIGSFAPTTAGFRLLKQMDDRVIPGTLNVCCCIPVIIEAILFIRAVDVEIVTLIGMLAASAVGAWVGATITSKLNVQPIRLGIGVGLIIAALFMIGGQVGIVPGGGEAIGLTGGKLVIGIAVNFVLGALMTIGIGLYSLCMALVYFLGMSPLVAFPIMMGSCAFLMPVASVKFIQTGAYNRRASLVVTITGSIGVFIAYFIVKSLPLYILRWLVVAVLIYTAITLLYTFFKTRKTIAAA